jgi:integrase/recombinase XerD
MQMANTTTILDTRKIKQDGTYPIKVRVTFSRKQRYYPTPYSLNKKDFERVMFSKRLTEDEKTLKKKITAFENKAVEAIEKLNVFTFDKFEEIYLTNRGASDSIAFGFDKYIKELREEKRIGTAVSYECAINSLENFRKDLKFADITRLLLVKYENWMQANGKSKTTVGIYLRSLRAVFNRANIDVSLYPFGERKDKYSIPTSRNIKKALTIEEIAKIFHYLPQQPGTNEELARDYWIFIYLCNGLNVKDLCLLKRKNIDGDTLKYERAKTKRSKKEKEEITVSLKPEAKSIIAKWGQPSINPETYIFPHLHKNMTAEREREIIQQVTKTINKYMKRIAKELEINKPITTYWARHSFSTVLKRSGASIEFISEALGHSDSKTTRKYLDSFENEAIHKTTDALTAFAK